MPGSEVYSDPLRTLAFAASLLMESDREGSDRISGVSLRFGPHQRDHDRRIDTTRQKRAYRHVEDQPLTNGLSEAETQRTNSPAYR